METQPGVMETYTEAIKTTPGAMEGHVGIMRALHGAKDHSLLAWVLLGPWNLFLGQTRLSLDLLLFDQDPGHGYYQGAMDPLPGPFMAHPGQKPWKLFMELRSLPCCGGSPLLQCHIDSTKS
jgi:hypothetical protein